MTLVAGTRIGSYEILAPIGAGGMGEVYRARDSKLNREVAIKVLPVAFANDSDRMARFEREAKVLASLNHPHIAAIYGLEESDGMRALVMELVEGPTLYEQMGGHAMALEETLTIVKQIAEALEYAHEKGIIHRDLKPANVKLTADGNVKVLDFGLAKALEEHAPVGNPSVSPTLTIEGTRAGVILGTAAYMAPEQARGAVLDRRADIWSFGVVLYEMLTGKQPFAGATVSDTLAAVLKTEPDLKQAPVPAQKLLRRCLDKDPKRRLRDIGDVWELLEEAPQAIAPSRSRLGWVVAAALALIAVGASWIAYRATRPSDLKPLMRLNVDLGAEVSLSSPSGADTIISPDSTRLVYVSQNRLFTRKLNQPQATELTSAVGAYAPFFSPDGQWVAFFAGGKLKKISVEGGTAIALCNAPNIARGGSWGDDNNIIAALNNVGVLSRIPSSGGAPAPVTELAQGELTHRWPQVLPGGKAVLYTVHTQGSGFDEANIEVMALGDRRRKTIQRGGTFGRYLPSGHVIYINKGALFAVPFDLDTLEARGTPALVLEQVGYAVENGSAQLDFSRNGTLVYRSAGLSGGELVTVQWMDDMGATRPLFVKPGSYLNPRLSPDGQRLALEMTEGSSRDVWIYDLHRATPQRLTFGGPGNNPAPVWTPDGRYIVFTRLGEGIFGIRADGTGKPQPLTQSKNSQIAFSFRPDGSRLAFQELNARLVFGIWTVPIENDGTGIHAGKPEVFLQTQFNSRHPAFSPDGRWLAYASDESGNYQVYVRAFADTGSKWQISNNGGMNPEWSHARRELFFRTEDSEMIMVAKYAVNGDSFTSFEPRVWAKNRLANTGVIGPNYDLASDGKRIVTIMPANNSETQQSQSHVTFLLNFFDELRQRVPIDAK